MARGGFRIRIYVAGTFWVQVDGFDRVNHVLQQLFEDWAFRDEILTGDEKWTKYRRMESVIELRHRK